MKRALLLTLAAIVVLAALTTGGWRWHQSRSADGEVRYRVAKVDRGPIFAVVAASGTLNAVSTVPVGTQVSGQIKEIFADFNTPVKKNQVLARIEPATVQLRVNQARADLDAAQSTVAAARSALAVQQTEVERVTVGLADAQRDFERKQMLADKKFISPAQLKKTRTVLDSMRERIKAAQAQLKANEAQVESTLAAVKQREALLKQAEMDLERTIIRAPVDGTVILRNVDAGQSVAVSRPPAVLFSIAQDLREVQVEAVIDEADARRLRTGMPASFAVDAFPRRSFTGEIRQIRKSPQTGSTIVISVDNADLALLPGMEANVRVILDSRTGALKVPNAALGFHPPGAKASAGRLWLLEAGEPKPVDVRLGLSDGTVTEVVSGGLKEADEIIIGVASPS